MIRNDTTQKCLDSNTDNNPLVEPGYCDQANTRQNWYPQPSDGGGGYYLIRKPTPTSAGTCSGERQRRHDGRSLRPRHTTGASPTAA
ncbi:hypothetical protein HRD51_35230 [Streptomyces sp. A1-5]|nr:hypothetical protein HRD51_35230 [Streptomyces sp. A1-5]